LQVHVVAVVVVVAAPLSGLSVGLGHVVRYLSVITRCHDASHTEARLDLVAM